MNLITLSDFGTTLGSRKLGKSVNEYVDFENNQKIIFDFQNVNVITSSFADELIGKNSRDLGVEEFFDRVEILNATRNIKLVIKKAIIDRLCER